MNNAMNIPACKCGNQACAFRAARGLVPFCGLAPSAPTPRKKPCKACASRPWAHGVIKCWHPAVAP